MQRQRPCRHDQRRFVVVLYQEEGFPQYMWLSMMRETLEIIKNIMIRLCCRMLCNVNIRQVDILNRVIRFIIDTIKSDLSKKLSDYLSQYRSVDINTIYSYLDAITSSYIISK